jgi:DNA-binding Lrp family transcriptional regulator
VVTAFVLIDVSVDAVPEVAEQIAAIEGVTEVWSCAGRYDLVVKVRVRRNEDLADVVAAGIDKVPGIRDSETLIGFRAYTPDAVDAAFSIGEDL